MHAEKPAHIETLASGNFRARVVDPKTGRRISITDVSKAKVEARLEEARRVAYQVKVGAADPVELDRRFRKAAFGEPSVTDLWRLYEATLRGPWKRKANQYFRTSIEPYLGKLRAFELQPHVMGKWEESLRGRGLGLVSVSNVFRALRACFRMAYRGRWHEIPWWTWRPEKVPEEHNAREACGTMGELGMLIQAALDYDANLIRKGHFGDMAVRILVMGLMGLRQGEAVALRWSDLRFENPELQPHATIRYAAKPDWHHRLPEPNEPPKGNKTRPQVLHEALPAVLRVHRQRLQERGWYREDGPVFPTRGGKFHHGACLIEGRILRRIVAAAGLPNVSRWVPHSLRHSFATLEIVGAWQLTGDVRTAMDRTGHKSMKVLMGYMHRVSRGAPSSFIPSLGAGVTEALQLAAAPTSPMEGASGVTRAKRNELVQIAQGIAEKVEVAESDASLVDLAKRYPTDVPKPVMDRAEARYRTAYSSARRAGASPEECQQKGRASKRAFLGAWGKMQARVARSVAHSSSEGETVELERGVVGKAFGELNRQGGVRA